MTDGVIKFENVSKVYRLYDNPLNRLKESLNPFGKKYHRDFVALNDVSFTVNQGQTLGIIGKNGAGKSTILKILAGVLTPSSGNVFVEGKIVSLLGLGVGFNPELNGYENIYFNASVLGYTREEVDNTINDILEFADIGDFIKQPVRTYSTGMALRLAFAIAINVDPDVLVIDEVLSVGDMRFNQKCFRMLDKFKEQGKTIVFVTHDVGAVVSFCDRAIWLHDGEIRQMASPKEVVQDYTAYMFYDKETVVNSGGEEADTLKNTESLSDFDFESLAGCSSFGEGGAEINGIALFFAGTREKVKIISDDVQLDMYLKFKVSRYIHSPILGFVLKDFYGNFILGLNSFILGVNLGPFEEGAEFLVKMSFRLPLIANGDYAFSPAVAEGTQLNHVQHHWVHDAYLINVNNTRTEGMGCRFMAENTVIELL